MAQQAIKTDIHSPQRCPGAPHGRKRDSNILSSDFHPCTMACAHRPLPTPIRPTGQAAWTWPRHPWFPGISRPLTQAGVPCKELVEGFALFAPVSAGLTAAPGRHTRAHVVQVVGGDHGACGGPPRACDGRPESVSAARPARGRPAYLRGLRRREDNAGHPPPGSHRGSRARERTRPGRQGDGACARPDAGERPSPPRTHAPAQAAALAALQGLQARGRRRPRARERAGGRESLAPALGARGAFAAAEEQRLRERRRSAREEAAQGSAAAGAHAAPGSRPAPGRCPAQASCHVLRAQLLAPLVCCARLGRVHAAIPIGKGRRPW